MTGAIDDRGQSNVVGVALLIGITMLGVAAIIAGVGTVIQSSATSAETAAVARDLDDVLDPALGHDQASGEVRLHGGTLMATDREVRVEHGGNRVLERELGGLLYRPTHGDGHVALLNGGIARIAGGQPSAVRQPRLSVGVGSNTTLMVAVVDVAWAGPRTLRGDRTVRVRTNRSTRRIQRPPESTRIAIETTTPEMWTEWFRDSGGTVRRIDSDGDGVPTVVAELGNRSLYLVVHDVRVTVDE